MTIADTIKGKDVKEALIGLKKAEEIFEQGT